MAQIGDKVHGASSDYEVFLGASLVLLADMCKVNSLAASQRVYKSQSGFAGQLAVACVNAWRKALVNARARGTAKSLDHVKALFAAFGALEKDADFREWSGIVTGMLDQLREEKSEHNSSNAY